MTRTRMLMVALMAIGLAGAPLAAQAKAGHHRHHRAHVSHKKAHTPQAKGHVYKGRVAHPKGHLAHPRGAGSITPVPAYRAPVVAAPPPRTYGSSGVPIGTVTAPSVGTYNWPSVGVTNARPTWSNTNPPLR